MVVSSTFRLPSVMMVLWLRRTFTQVVPSQTYGQSPSMGQEGIHALAGFTA